MILEHEHALLDVFEMLAGFVCEFAEDVGIVLEVDRGELIGFLR